MVVTPDELAALAENKYLLLTTFRRNGNPVSTPVWAVRDDDRLLVLTDSNTGKVKRVRHSARVQLTPCDPRGRVKPGSATLDGAAEVVEDTAEIDRLKKLMRRRYGAMYPVVAFVERLRGRPTSNTLELRITF